MSASRSLTEGPSAIATFSPPFSSKSAPRLGVEDYSADYKVDYIFIGGS